MQEPAQASDPALSSNARRGPPVLLPALVVGLVAVLEMATGLLPAEALNLPPSPAGYTWMEFRHGNSAYLKPSGWFAKMQMESDVPILYISKEDLEKTGSYRTGLSVTVIRQVRQRAGMTPSQFAARSVAKTAATKDVLSQWATPGERGLFNAGFRYRDPSPMPMMLVHTLLLADDAGDVLHILVFSAPESEWERAWVHGERMMKEMLVG